MTQTQTPDGGTPDPDRPPDPDLGPDPDLIQTRTSVRTQTGPDPAQTQTDGPGPGRHPDPDQARTQTRTAGPDRTGRIARHAAEPGPDDTQTETETQTIGTRTLRGAGAVRAWMGRGGYLTALTAVVAVVAAIGQKVYAETEHFTNQIRILGFDFTPWFAPFVFDLAVAALLHGGIRAARDRFSPWPWWCGGAVVAGLSIYTNSQHDGAQITASASAGLFLIWGLYLYNQYKMIVRRREVADSQSDEMLPTDVLFTIDPPLAERARLIARTKPLASALAYRHRLEETLLTKRDLAILAARLYIDIHADELYSLMNPHLVAAPAAAAPAGKHETKVRWWQHGRRARARRLATMTAADNVDRYLGIPVPERRGMVVSRFTYVPQEDVARLGSATAPALPAAAAAPAAPALTAAPATPPGLLTAPQVRRRITSAPAWQPESPPAVAGLPPRPTGNGKENWVRLDEIPGLPELDLQTLCECNLKRRCGRTLVDHVQRRGKQVTEIVTVHKEWAVRTERIAKDTVKTVCGLGGDGGQNEVAGLFDHLRKIAQARQAGKDADATAATTVVNGTENIEGT